MYTKQIKLNIPEKYQESLKDFFLIFLDQYAWKDLDKELYLVGGCVRDLLSNKEPKDIDLCTNLLPDQVKAIMCPPSGHHFSAYDSGIKHGTVTIHDNLYHIDYEVTTFRTDGKYEDGRHPKEVSFVSSLEEDLKRRDFTVNAIAYDPRGQKIITLEESFVKDVEMGRIRCVGAPTARFSEDALRILRAFRFAAQKGYFIDNETYKATKECAPLLQKISKERVRDELTKILLSNEPRYLELMLCSGIEPYLFDGKTPLMDMLNCPHDNKWHYTDVFHHTLDVVERVPSDFILRWAALFHDIGKPAVRAPHRKEPGVFTYYGHPEVSEKIALELMQMLKFTNEQIDVICKYVRYHDAELAICKMSTFKRILVDIGINRFLDFMKIRIADSSAHSIILDQKYAVENISICYERYYKVIGESMPLTIRDLKINGNDLKARGYEGPEIGKVLRWLLDRVLDNPDDNTPEGIQKWLEYYDDMMFQSS